MTIFNELWKKLNKPENEPVQNEPVTANNVIPPGVTQKTRGRYSYRKFLIIAVLVILILVVVDRYYSVTSRDKQYQKKRMVVVQDATQFPTRIKQFEILNDVNKNTIHLQFNLPVAYRIDTESNIITIELPKVAMPAKTPIVEKTLVESIMFESSPQLLKIKLTLAKGAQLGAHQTTANAQDIDLTINAQASLSMIDKELVNPAAYSAEADYQKAIAELKDGRETMALETLEKAVSGDKNYYPAQLALIKLLMKKSSFKESQQYLTLALSQRPDEIDLILLQASLWFQEGQSVQAEKLLSSHTPSLSDHLDYYATQAYIENSVGNHALAIQLYEQVLAINSYNGNWWLGLALSLQQDKQNNAAIVAYKRALQTNNLSPSVRIYIASQLQLLS